MLTRALTGVVLSALSTSGACRPGRSAATRPPQHVVFSFDGSRSVDMWEDSRALAARIRKDGARANFTYFISGVYFIQSSLSATYRPPRRPPGESMIGFGGTSGEVRRRRAAAFAAASEGHELAAHGNGHFDGRDWNLDEWESELRQFWLFAGDMVGPSTDGRRSFGFRAPFLRSGSQLHDALERMGYAYDASGIRKFDQWPLPRGRLWQFGVSPRPIVDTARTSLCMDYAFYEAQSAGREDVSRAALFEAQMYRTYRQYFVDVYYGNRAPMQFIQHFEMFNNGAYWRALQRFALDVCHLPEVRCVSYREMVEWLDGQATSDLRAYQRGDFPRSTVDLPW